MSRINLNIVATGDFSSVNRQLDSLRATVAQINARGAGIGISQRDLDSVSRAARSYDSLLHSTGAFSRQMVNVQDQTARFGRELEAGKLKLGQYFQIWSRGSSEARRNMRELAAQQIALENAIVRTDTSKIGKAYVDVPRLMQEAGRGTALARKEQQLYNLALYQGGNAMINWGKNTQWAGRQLTVGLTVPLMMFGQKAANAFKEFDQQMTRMIKVYGDGINSATTSQLQAIRSQVTSLATELAQNWGVAMKDTAATASDLAATGLTGIKLLNATKEATRLATLGELDRQDAIKATIALQTTFGLNNKELAQSVDFLNATENATSTSLQDLVEAIPRAGTVVKALGGDYKELTVMMVAMREAGVSSGEAANAIKSTLGALINPTKKTREEFQKFGIDLRSVRDAANGDPVRMFANLGVELNKLDKISKSRLIETLFGKYQFARVTALIDNLGRAGSQTQKVFGLMGATVGQMASSSKKEMDALTNSVSMRYQRAMEKLMAQIMPIGEKFLTVASDILGKISNVLEFIDQHPGLKNFLSSIAPLVGLVGPVIMLTGVFGNFLGYLVKGFATIKNFGNGFKGFGKLVTAESVAAARAGDLFQASLVGQSEAAAILTEALTRLNAELMTYRGQAGGAAGGPGPIPPIIPPGGGGGSRPPTRPSGPVILGGGVEPTGTPPQLIIPGKTSGGGELIIPGKPDKVVISGPVSVAMGGSAPIAATMSGSAIDEWQPRSDAKGGRRGTAILHSTSRQELIAEIQHEITKDIMTPGTASPLGQIVNAAGKGTGPLGLNFRAKQEAARAARLKSKGGSTLLTDDDYAVAKKNLLDELVTRGAWSAKGAPPSGAAAAINSAIGSVPQHFSMPSAAALSAVGVSLTPEMEKEIMLQQLRAWGAKAGPGALGKVEDIISGKGSTQLSGPELQSWLGTQSRMPQAGRAFVDSTMAQAEKLLTTHSGLIDENLTKLYKEATAAAGSGDWEATKTAVTSLQEHMKQNFSYMGESLEKRIAEVNRQYDMAFKDAFRLTDANLDMTERVRIAAENAQAKVDKFLDQEGMRIAQKFAENEKALDAASSQLGISTRYSRQGMGEVVTAAASRSVAAADRVSRAEENIGNAVAESINESNAAMEQAAAAEEQAAARVRSATTGSAPGLIIPGRTGSAPKKIIIPGRRAMGGPIYYGPGGGVSGPGGPKDDLIPAYLSNGEFVIKADSVDKIGVNNLRHMNETGTLPGMAMGGLIKYFSRGGSAQINYSDERRLAYPPSTRPSDNMWKLLQDNDSKAQKRLLTDYEKKIVRAHIKKILGADYQLNKTQVDRMLNQLENTKLRDLFGLEISHIKGGPNKVRQAAQAGLLNPSAENQFMKMLSTSEAGWNIDHTSSKYENSLWNTLHKSGMSEDALSTLKKVVGGRGGSSLTFAERTPALEAAQKLIAAHNDPTSTFRLSNRALMQVYGTERLLSTYQTEETWNAHVRQAAENALKTRYADETVARVISSKGWMEGLLNPRAQGWRRGWVSPFYRRAFGGPIYGSGTSTSDSIPARLSNGEYVISAKGHKAAGTRFLDAINNGQFTMGYARGGRVHYKNGVRAFPDGDAVESSGFKINEKRGMTETRQQEIQRMGFDAPPPTQMTAAGQAAGRSMASAALSGLGKGSKAVGQIMGKAAIAGLEGWADRRERRANMTPEERAKDKQERRANRGMKSMAAGMGLGIMGGILSASDDAKVQGLGTVATFAGMGSMLGPYGMAAGAAIGAAKAIYDFRSAAEKASNELTAGYAKAFSSLTTSEQNFMNVSLTSLNQIGLDSINEQTGATTSALQQFAASLKEAAQGTVEYSRRQAFAQAFTPEDLLKDPRFQSLVTETRAAAYVKGGSAAQQEKDVKAVIQGYLMSEGKQDWASKVFAGIGDKFKEVLPKQILKQDLDFQNKFREYLVETSVYRRTRGAETSKRYGLEKDNIPKVAEQSLQALPKLAQSQSILQQLIGENQLSVGTQGRIGDIGGLIGDKGALQSLIELSQGRGKAGIGGTQTLNVGGRDLIETNPQDVKFAKDLLESISMAISGSTELATDMDGLRQKFSELYGTMDSPEAKMAFSGFLAMGTKSSQMLNEMFANLSPKRFTEFAKDFIDSAGNSSDAAALAKEDFINLRKSFDAMADSPASKSMKKNFDAVVDALTRIRTRGGFVNNSGGAAAADIFTLEQAARAAKVGLVELGYELKGLNGQQVRILIDRVIRTRELRQFQQQELAPQIANLEQGVAAAHENAQPPSDSGSGGNSGGGGGGSSPQFDSTPYDKAIKGQQAIIELINKEREARQKLADAQKANDDYMKSEWALRKKIAEAQGAGDFLGADLAQRELNQLQEQKAKDDAERLKRDQEDKRLQAAQKEIERLQEALAAAQKAFDQANQGGGSSGGGGGGGGGGAAPSGPQLPPNVTADQIRGFGMAGVAQAVVQNNAKTLADALKNPMAKEAYDNAVIAIGKDAADTLFNTFLNQSRENIFNDIPEFGTTFEQFSTDLSKDSQFQKLGPNMQELINNSLKDIVIDPKLTVKEKDAQIEKLLRKFHLNAETIKGIKESWRGLGPTIQGTIQEINSSGLQSVMYKKLKAIIPDLPDWEKLTKSQKTTFSTILSNIVTGADLPADAIKGLAEALLPSYSGQESPARITTGKFKGKQIGSTKGDVNPAKEGLTKAITDLIGPATSAAEKESNNNPIDMTATTSVIRVPNGTVTFEDGKDPQWTGNGEYTSVNTAVKKADGGYISGPGGPRDDLIPAMLSDGEYVVQASAVDHYGTGLLDSINTRKFADGGKVKKMQDMMNIVKNRAAGISGFMEMDRKLKFADGGHVRGTPRGIPNQDFISKVEPLAEKYQNTRYSSQVPGVPGNAPGVRGHGGGGWGCATSVYWLFTHGLGSSFGLDPSMSDNNLHSAIRNGPINGPYLPGDIVLMKNDQGVNLWADANHTEMVMSGNRVWNGGVGIRSGLSFRYPIVGVKRPLNAGYIFPEVDSKDSFMTNANSKYTIGKFHNGGAVQYSKGGEVMAMVQGGEVVVPINTVDKVNPLLDALTSGKMGLGEITNNITINGANHSPKVIAEMVVGEIEKSMKRTVNITRVR